MASSWGSAGRRGGAATGLRMIAGLEEISDGQLRIGDRVVNDVAPKDRDIAMVFQSYALYPHMSVRDNMAFGLKLREGPAGASEQRATADAARRQQQAGAQRPSPHPEPREAARPQAEGAARRPAPARRPWRGDRPRA